jgi:hypothetical protein
VVIAGFKSIGSAFLALPFWTPQALGAKKADVDSGALVLDPLRIGR